VGFPDTSNKYGARTASSRTVTAYYVTTDKFSVSFTRSSLYHCQYRDAELIGRLEGNQFSSSKKLRRLRVTSAGADPRVSPRGSLVRSVDSSKIQIQRTRDTSSAYIYTPALVPGDRTLKERTTRGLGELSVKNWCHCNFGELGLRRNEKTAVSFFRKKNGGEVARKYGGSLLHVY